MAESQNTHLYFQKQGREAALAVLACRRTRGQKCPVRQCSLFGGRFAFRFLLPVDLLGGPHGRLAQSLDAFRSEAHTLGSEAWRVLAHQALPFLPVAEKFAEVHESDGEIVCAKGDVSCHLDSLVAAMVSSV